MATTNVDLDASYHHQLVVRTKIRSALKLGGPIVQLGKRAKLGIVQCQRVQLGESAGSNTRGRKQPRQLCAHLPGLEPDGRRRRFLNPPSHFSHPS